MTITGTNFAAGATVTFGGTAATNVSGGEQHDDHGDDAGRKRRGGDGDGDGEWTEREPGQWVHLQRDSSDRFRAGGSGDTANHDGDGGGELPGSADGGDLNVVVVGWNDTTATVQSVVDSAGNTYSLAIGPTSGTALRQSIYYAPNIEAGSNTVTVTFNQAAAFPDVRILEYRGVSTVDVTAGASGSGTAANSGAATTTGSERVDLWGEHGGDGEWGGGERVHGAHHHRSGQ